MTIVNEPYFGSAGSRSSGLSAVSLGSRSSQAGGALFSDMNTEPTTKNSEIREATAKLATRNGDEPMCAWPDWEFDSGSDMGTVLNGEHPRSFLNNRNLWSLTLDELIAQLP